MDLSKVKEIALFQIAGKRRTRFGVQTVLHELDNVLVDGTTVAQIARRPGARVFFLPFLDLSEVEERAIYSVVCDLRKEQGKFGEPAPYVRRKDLRPKTPETVKQTPPEGFSEIIVSSDKVANNGFGDKGHVPQQSEVEGASIYGSGSSDVGDGSDSEPFRSREYGDSCSDD